MNLEIIKENLEKRQFKATAFETAQAAAEYLNQQIDKTTVGIGGSRTVDDMKLFELLNSHNEVWWHGNKALLEEFGANAIRENAMQAEVYISSVNGASETGSLINIDGLGNRISSTAYGHKRVFLIVSKNKIEESFDKALWRARNIAAPRNAMRLGMKTPCAIKGDKCYDCSSPDRICRGFLIMERGMTGQETEVILVNEDLGF